jgi:hypothetical protein
MYLYWCYFILDTTDKLEKKKENKKETETFWCISYSYFIEWVSDWCISWREQVNFQWDDDEVRFLLHQHAELDFYSNSSLKKQSVGKYVAPLGPIILIPSKPVFALSP